MSDERGTVCVTTTFEEVGGCNAGTRGKVANDAVAIV